MSGKFMLGSACAVTAMVTPHLALAHGDHGGGAGAIVPQGVIVVTAEYDYTRFNEISDANLGALADQGVEEVHSLKSIAIPSASISYGLLHDLTVGVRIPYLVNQEIRETDPADPPGLGGTGVNARGGVKGFGDVSFTGTYRVLHQANAGFDGMITLGVKAPTGETHRLDVNGERFEAEHQPGSGSWDGIFGASASRSQGNWTFGTSGTYGLAGEGSLDTTLGDRFNYGVSASYHLALGGFGGQSPMHLGRRFDGMMHHGGLDHSESGTHHHDADDGPALDLSLALIGEWWGAQDVAGVRDENTGGHVLFLTPGVRLSINQWSSFFAVGIPVSRELNGIQSDPDWRITSGSSLQF